MSEPSETSPLLANSEQPHEPDTNNQELCDVPMDDSLDTAPSVPALPKVDTNISWPTPAGLPPRGPNDENLVIFRRALGINSHLSTSTEGGTLEQGRKAAVGVYRAVLHEQTTKKRQHRIVGVLIYLCYFAQIVIGAVLTALGPAAAHHALTITILGAVNTIIAGVLALMKGQGLPERLRKDEIEFRKLQDWIEETESLLAVGIIGRDRKEVGFLVEVAFKKYNAAKASEENNKPDNYVRQTPEANSRPNSAASENSTGNAIVRLNVK